MTSYNYSITAFHDFGCHSDPIIFISSKSGCLPTHSCKETTNAPYPASVVSCSDKPITFVNSTRDYAIKSIFTGSEDCTGLPYTQYVVAADYACHPNPQFGHEANQAYFQVSCNGGFLPVWNSCFDKDCRNCTAISATSACMLGGAGTSNGYQCIKATLKPSVTTTSAFRPSSSTAIATPTNDPFSSASKNFRIDGTLGLVQIFVLPLVILNYLFL